MTNEAKDRMPQSYAHAPDDVRKSVEQLIQTYGADPALLAGAMVAATCRALLAAERRGIERVAEEFAQIVEWRVNLFPEDGTGLTARNALKEAANSIRAAAIRQLGESP